jgi:hypothetical protein
MAGARRLVPVLAASLLAALPLHPVRAATASAGAPEVQVVGSYPHGYIEFTASPGQTLHAEVIVADGGTIPATFTLTAVDGYTSPASGVVYGNREHPLRDGPSGNGEFGAGSWISLDQNQLSLGPGQAATVHLTIAVPQAHPGDWVGGLSAENPVVQYPGGGSGGPSLGVKEATAIAVVVHVPGQTSPGTMFLDQPTVKVVGIEDQLSIPLRYTGDVLTKPLFNFHILDAKGSVVYSHSGRFDTFMPHTTIVYTVAMPQPLGAGDYTFIGSAGPDGHEQTATFPMHVGSVPPTPRTGGGSGSPQGIAAVARQWYAWPIVAGILLLAAGLAILLAWRRRCSHCGHLRLWGTLRVEDYQEIAHCQPCRDRARERQTVRLCSTCYRSHVRATTGDVVLQRS